MTTKTDTYIIEFRPQNSRVKVPPGTLVLDAAAEVGIFIDIPCGGQGRCGRCQVKVEEGNVTHRENPHLTPEQVQGGWILSCTARVATDLLVTVPPKKERDRAIVETASSRGALTITSDWPRYPAVQQYYLELSPPSLDDTLTDLDRVLAALARDHNVDNVVVPLPVLRKLPRALRETNWQVTATVSSASPGPQVRLIDVNPGQHKGPVLGVAVDIGTTSVVAYLIDLRNGRLLESLSAFNKQISCGEDVISRIVYSQRGRGLAHLNQLVLETINELLEKLARRQSVSPTDIQDMVVAGNTTMIHFFLSLPARQIREEPYVPIATHFPLSTASELGVNINPNAAIYCLPSVAAYVGGDITAGVLSSNTYKAEKLTLFLDVGTNGEMVLGNSDWLVTCACSAGPAFEGAGVRWGTRAVEGAIQDVRISSKTLEPTIDVIGDVPPIGICGSGMISALAEMLVTGVIDKNGHINVAFVQGIMGEKSRVRQGDHGWEYVMARSTETGMGEDIVLTEVDMDNLIRTKAAIYAGMAVMARSVGIPLSDVEEVLIGGAFGQHINVEQAIQIGLLPDLPWERFKYLGNTSAWGAYNSLLSKYARVRAEDVARKMTYLELIADNSFMHEFTSALFLPHTDLDSFPSVKELLENNRRQEG